MRKKLLAAVLGAVIMGCWIYLLVASDSKISPADYIKLESKNEILAIEKQALSRDLENAQKQVKELEADLYPVKEELESTKEEMESIQADYNIYKRKMEPYEELYKADLKAEVAAIKKADEESAYFSLKYGKLLDANPKGGVDRDILVIKAKIESNLTNKMTIAQNYHNIEDIILHQGGDKYAAIDYWAVADMTDGEETKVISFTVSKSVINDIYEGTIPVTEYGDYVDDLFIIQSLLD